MSDLPSDLDLKFLPDWLKESSAGNRYADYEGESGERPQRADRERDRDRGPRPDRGERRGGGGPKPRGDRPGPRREGRRDDRPRGDRRHDKPQDRRDRPPQDRRPAAPTAPTVKVEFLPEPNGVAGIARQIKSSNRAYPLFGTARLFLEKPERHRVRITSLDEARPLFQIGDGPVSFDRAALERNAFRQMKSDYYKEEVIQGEPIKGNFTNVARSRTTGVLLGPTNYHAYQPGLRKLYEERFSRRMSFPQFQQEEIEVVTDEQAIADWKEQARSSTTFTTAQEAEPVTFKSASEAEQHFRQTYLPQLVKSGTSLETGGHASRASGDRGINAALREAWEKERAFPANIVNRLRPSFVEAGLHFFKHRKRILYISPIRPQRHASGQVFSAGIAAILGAVESQPKITRPQLAAKLLGENHEAPDFAQRKAALAGDLHYLVHAGHVIEFHDGTLDLPLSPKAEAHEPAEKPAAKLSADQPAPAPLPAEEELSAAQSAVEEEAALIGSDFAVEEAGALIAQDAVATIAPEPAMGEFVADAMPAQLDRPLVSEGEVPPSALSAAAGRLIEEEATIVSETAVAGETVALLQEGAPPPSEPVVESLAATDSASPEPAQVLVAANDDSLNTPAPVA